MRERRIVVAAAGIALLAAVAHHPSADIRLITHEANDPSPHRMQAAVDFGLVGVSLLYTWTAKRIR